MAYGETVAVLDLSLPVLEAIARGLAQDGDEDISATYLTIAPEHAA